MKEYVARIEAMFARRRQAVRAAATGVFVLGIGISVWSLDLSWDQLSAAPVLLILFVFAPLALVGASISLQLTALAVGRRIGFREALGVSALGILADLLPVPGGAMTRGAALMRAGAGLGESSWMVSMTAALMLSMAAALGSVPLLASGSSVGDGLLAAGGAGCAVSAALITRRAGIRVVSAMVVVRLASLSIAAFGLSSALAAIGTAASPVDAALLLLAGSLGQAIAVVPSGFGIGEALASALAMLVAIPPGAAFIAVALNRFIVTAVCGAVVIALFRFATSSEIHGR